MKLSVITVTYKDPLGLQETLQSLETLQPIGIIWEHLIVDSSPEINREVLAKLPTSWPLRHLVVPPEGVYAAMNAGIAAASGETLWFLNGGDKLIAPDALLGFIQELLQNSDLEMICAGCELVRGTIYLYPKLPKNTFIQSILYRNQLSHQAVLYKKSIFDKVGNFSLRYRIAADYEHYFRCYVAGVRARCVSACLARCDLTGISSVRWRESLNEATRISKELRDKLPTSIYLQHQIYCRMEFARVWAIKQLRRYFDKAKMKSLWLWWNRRV
jgi:glycosyltransferase involved in cell wall biosynthesis